MDINLKLINHLIAIAESNEAATLKGEAVRRQDFEAASKYREQEKEAWKGLLSSSELKELREDIIKQNAPSTNQQ